MGGGGELEPRVDSRRFKTNREIDHRGHRVRSGENTERESGVKAKD
jgi:hypothetical protein